MMGINIKFLLSTVIITSSCVGMETGQKRTRENDSRVADAVDGLFALGGAERAPVSKSPAIVRPIALRAVGPTLLPAGWLGTPRLLGFSTAAAIQESINSINPTSERVVSPRIDHATAGKQLRGAAAVRAEAECNVKQVGDPIGVGIRIAGQQARAIENVIEFRPQQDGGHASGGGAADKSAILTVDKRRKKKQRDKIRFIVDICKQGDKEALERLICERRANASYALMHRFQGFNKSNPVHVVAQYNHSDLLRTLVESNADINKVAHKKNKTLVTTLDVAQQAGNEDMVVLIRSLGGKSYSEKEKEQEFAGGASGSSVLESVQDEGLTAQQRADGKHKKKLKEMVDVCKKGDIQHFEVFIKQRAANVNCYLGYTDGVKKTRPIHIAALCGHLDLVRYLIEKGADINAVAKKYKGKEILTAYDLAPEGPIKQLIREHGGRSYAQLQAEESARAGGAGGGAGGGR